MDFKLTNLSCLAAKIVALCTVVLMKNNYCMERYYEIPGDVIEQIAAYYPHKNKFTALNRTWNTFCSRKNADNILRHSPLILSSNDKQYFLNYYAYTGNIPIVTNLLNNGADINHINALGMTPLLCACDNLNNEGMISLLIKSGAQPIKELPVLSPLHKAVYYGKINIVKSLIVIFKEYINKQQNDITPLITASGWGNSDIAQTLVEHGANINMKDKDGNTPLHSACRYGHFEVARLLLEHGANINEITKNNRHTPLVLACMKGHFDIVQLLLNSKANVDVLTQAKCTPLHIVCDYGYSDIVQLLLNHGVKNVNAEGQDGWMPLHFACQNGHLTAVQLLLTHGADAYKEDKAGNTPLQIAYKNKHASLVKFFAENMSKDLNT